jgi:exonuclease III
MAFDYNYDIKMKSKLASGKTISTKLKLGLSVASVNAHGLSDPSKCIDLYNWMVSHDIDIMCIQEWYIPHKLESKIFENNIFYNYNIIQTPVNTKTLIICKNIFNCIEFSDLNSNINGLDITWLGIVLDKSIMVIVSLYHSPTYECTYEIINEHMKLIESKLKNYGKKIIFQINGDFNSKHHLWGSKSTDNRGEYALDWMCNNNLDFINNGNCTYRNSNTHRENAIDLSLISMDYKNTIARWSIHKELTIKSNFPIIIL